MVRNNSVPSTNAGRESAPTIWGWITYLDLLIALVFDIIPGILIMSVAGIGGLWMLLMIMIMIGWFMLLTYPKIGGGTKLYFYIWDMFVWFGTKKIYNAQEVNKAFGEVFDKLENKDEPYIRYATVYSGKKATSTKKPFLFYEIITSDISLCSEDEIDIILSKYQTLFQLSDEGNIAQIKIDWIYNFNSNVEFLTNNVNKWKDEKKKDSDILIQTGIDKLHTIQNLTEGSEILQKKYFLIFSAQNLEKAMRLVGNVRDELLMARLNLREATDEMVKACLTKLNPAVGNEIKFTTRGYEITNLQTKQKQYYRTVMLTSLPKIVSAFWNQELFNLDNITINIQYKNINEKQKNRYSDKLKEMIDEKKARTLTDKAAKMAEIEAIQELAMDIGIGGAKLKQVKYLLTYSAGSLKELSQITRFLRNTVVKGKMRLHQCWMKQWDVYCANIPTFGDWMNREANMMLSDITLALSYPYTYSDYIDDKGDYYGNMVDSYNPIFIDFAKVNKEINNWSTIVVGKPGGGKSTLVKEMGINFITNPRYRKIFFIDPENEYTDLVNNFDGTVVDCSGSVNGGRINPFHVYMSGDEEGGGAGENYTSWKQHFFFLKTFLGCLFNGDLNEQELSNLLAIITKVYADKKISANTNFKTLKETQFPVFSDIANKIHKLLIANDKTKDKRYSTEFLEKALSIIGLYCKESDICSGNFAYLWDGPSNITIDSRIMSFNINKLIASSVPKNIKTTQMQLILKFIEETCIDNKIYNEKLRILWDNEKCFHTACFVDEFHLLADEKFPEPIEWFYHFVKRIRKYKGKLVPITQSIADLTGSIDILKQTTGIINACPYKFIFHMEANDIENLDKLFGSIGGLKQEEKTFLKGKLAGECIFGVGTDTRIKMKVDYRKGLLRDLIEKNMSEYKKMLIEAERGLK